MQSFNLLTVEKNFEIEELIGSNVTFVNPFSYLEISKPSEEPTIHAFKIFADGIGVVILYNLFLRRKIKRFAFDNTSVAPLVLNFAQENQLKVFLVGGKPGTAKIAGDLLLKKHPHLNLVGIKSGYFDASNPKAEVLREAQNADIVIVGMGAPLQEKFLSELREIGWKGTGFTCGGFLDQTATKGIVYFPKWIDALHLRSLYRLLDEPSRLGKRYLLTYPKFIVLFFIEIIRLQFSKV
jgi:N-acetylglucosaminyldiphosphoundecaprenol N-acetyl-beta-D-mannosaminyltransferase